MMVSCPKCGFTQPEDRYCASCGVDMLAFKPAEKPFAQKLMSNWIFQVAALGLILIVAYVSLRGRARHALEERVSDIEDAPTVRVLEEMEKHVRDPRPDENRPTNYASSADKPGYGTGNPGYGNSGSGSGSAPGEGAPTSSAARGFMRTAESTLGEPGSAGNSATATTVQRVRIVFAEVRKQMVADLVSSARNLASYSLQAGVIPDLAARLKNESRGMRTLEPSTEYPVRLNQPIVVFKGVRDDATDRNVGVTLQIVPTAIDENGLSMQVEILRALREGTSTPQVAEENFQEAFVAPKEGGVFLAVPLPRRTLSDDETRLYSGANVLRILGFQSYQSNATDLLIFIEAH